MPPHLTLAKENMKFLIWVGCLVLVVVVLLIAGFILLTVRAAKVTARRDKAIDDRIAPALSFLRDGSPPDQNLILSFAQDPLTRNRCFSALAEAGRSDLFPHEFRELSLIAESDMVRWLSHGNELGTAPDQIELVHEHEVEAEGRSGRVFLFRFRVEEPHWASGREWMAGVSGPFWSRDDDNCSGGSTFSELESYSGRTNSEHVEFLARAAGRFGWVMPTSTQ